MAMKIMPLRVAHGMKHTFRCTPENENITREDMENKEFVKQKIEKKCIVSKIDPEQRAVLGGKENGSVCHDQTVREAYRIYDDQR